MKTVGIIGCGNIANSAHIPAYMKNDDVSIKYFCDIKMDRPKRLSKSMDVERLYRIIRKS